MKRRSVDPVIVGILLFVAVVSGAIALGLTLGSKESQWQEACSMMGGVPLVGHNSTKVCFKTDVILSVN